MSDEKNASPVVRKRKIADYTADNANANTGTVRGFAMIEDSLNQDGAGRSIVVDADGRIVAGNKTWEAAAAAGIEEVIEVETDGHSLIVHRRNDWDLTEPTGPARRYAYRDNRASQVSLSWNADQIAADVAAGIDLGDMFTPSELGDIGVLVPDFVPVGAEEQPRLDKKAPVVCPHCGQEFTPE